MTSRSFTSAPLIGAAAVIAAVMMFGNLRTTEVVPVQPAAPTSTCEQTFDRISAQKRLMQDPALVSSRPDATDSRVTPVEWMMLTDWQRQVVVSQNSALPGNSGSCNPVALGDDVDIYATP